VVGFLGRLFLVEVGGIVVTQMDAVYGLLVFSQVSSVLVNILNCRSMSMGIRRDTV
jgi:hypothetical protein